MKLNHGLMGLGLACVVAAMPACRAETNTPAGRVGVYDSRAVAYAWFCSDAQQAQLKEKFAAARAAKQAGDQGKYQAYSAELRAQQDQMHREAFSTAPAAEALEVLKDRIPEIEKAAGVSDLVSKWDESALRNHQGAEKVDVTDGLVRALLINPTDKQLKTINALTKSEPLPLDKCNELIRKGKI